MTTRLLREPSPSASGSERALIVHPQLPRATIIAGMSSCCCHACGKGCDLSEKKHITLLPTDRRGTGCGIEFTHITTRSLAPQMKNGGRRARPDLEFIEFPTNGG